MDEPSATLTKNELDVLFETIRRLRSQGVTIIYISHRMEEIFQLADDVSILRDGKFIGTLPVAKTNQEELINMMVGREINVDYPRSGVTPGDVILSVRNLSTKSLLRDISFELRQGEILGIAGLVGAGRTELARATSMKAAKSCTAENLYTIKTSVRQFRLALVLFRRTESSMAQRSRSRSKRIFA